MFLHHWGFFILLNYYSMNKHEKLPVTKLEKIFIFCAFTYFIVRAILS